MSYKSKRYSIEDLKKAIKNSVSWRQVTVAIGLKYAGGNVQNLKRKAKENGLDFSHFRGKGWNLGGKARNEVPIEEWLVDGIFVKSTNLKNKLLKYGMLEYKCSKCGISKWMNEKIILELDHVDGNVLNNQIDNLRLLCPNCHSQTPTFRGKNIVEE